MDVMNTAGKILFVAVGGAFGAVARYLINISPLARVFEKFPFTTFLINIAGSFLIGFSVIMFAGRFQVSENMKLALVVGFLGAFTTFSTFEMELYGLTTERNYVVALLYLVLSVVVGFIGVVAGVWLGRKLAG